MSKPLIWYLRRHPLLYKIRYRLVSKTVSQDSVKDFCYNDINKKNSIAAVFFEINHLIFTADVTELTDFEKAKTISIWLKNNIKGGPGLGKSSSTALRKMIEGKGGVCSDFSQIFSNFCVINNIKVKEWGMKNLSKDPKVSGGHSYNEVYCPEFKKWILIDVAKSVLLYQKDTDIPLSSLEYIQLKKENKEIIIFTIIPNDSVDLESIRNIFLISDSLPFVITNYNNKSIDTLLDKLSFFPESIIHGILIIIGKGYNFEFPKIN